MPQQTVSDPNPAELDWIRRYVAGAGELAGGLTPGAGDPLGVDDLDRLWEAWLATGPAPEEANDVVLAVGLAFGQRLVDDLGFRWAVVTDEYGTEMAVHADPGDVLLFPPNLVAKRWETRDTGFLRPIFDEAARVRAGGPGPEPKRRKRFGLF